jgi:hypothetical protein
VIPALSDFLTGTVSDSLAKLVQPVGSFPAAVFVLLNLAFVYPSARADHVRIAERFSDLDQGWQLVVVASAILVLGYLLLSVSSIVVQLLGGQGWRETLLHHVLVRRAKKRRAKLAAAAQGDEAVLAQWRLATDFPLAERVEATALGNSLAATQDVINDRYGIDIAALWSDMEAATPADSSVLASVKDERAGLDLLANLTVALAAFTVEGVLFFDAHRAWTSALLSLLVGAAAVVAYRAAVAKANSWGVAVSTVFDLEREKLWTALGLRAAPSASEKRDLWQKASKFFLPLARDDEPPPEVPSAGVLFDALEAPLTLQTTENVTARALSRAIVADAPFVADDLSIWLVYAEYVLAATRTESLLAFGGVDAAVAAADAAVKRVAAVDGPDGAMATVLRNPDGSDLLLWRFQRVAPGGEQTVSYRLPIWRALIDVSEIECEVSFDNGGHTLKLRNTTNEPQIPTLTLSHDSDPTDARAPHLAYGGAYERSFEQILGEIPPQAERLAVIVLPQGE